MRISSVVLPLVLAGCGGGAPDPVAQAAAADRLECARAGAALARACVAERDGDVVVLRHADGGFRRISVAADGSAVSADGAEPVRLQTLADGRVELGIAGDVYRLPGLER